MRETYNGKYTGFNTCKYLIMFEDQLKIKRISRRNRISSEIEVILKPSEYEKTMRHLRKSLEDRIESKLDIYNTMMNK